MSDEKSNRIKPLLQKAAALLMWTEGSMFLDAVQHHQDQAETVNNFMDQHFSSAVQDVVRYQGEDFLIGPLDAYMGGEATLALLSFSEKLSQSKLLKQFNENKDVARSAIGFSQLGLYELIQAQGPGRHFDLNDMLAYGTGIALYFHGKNIITGTCQTVNHMLNTVVQIICPITKDLKV